MIRMPETELRRTIKQRDGISDDDFDEMLIEAGILLRSNLDPEEVMYEIFSLEPDYIFDLIEELERVS